MSIKLMSAVWQMKLNSTDKLVFLALADNTSDEGVCWPSVSTICKKTCLSRRGVQASVARLHSEGYLQRVFKNGHSNNYLIRIINGENIPAHDVRPPAHMVHPSCAPGAPPPAHDVRPEPSSEPPKEPSKNQMPSSIPVWLDQQVWDSFIAHRKAMRKPLTPKACELAFSRLGEFKEQGMSPEAVINQTIVNGWQGLFELKVRANGKAHKRTYSDDLIEASIGAMKNSERKSDHEIY